MHTALRSTVMVALAGCAGSAPKPAVDVGAERVILTSESGIIMGERPRASTLDMSATPASAWQMTKKVYEALGIPVTFENPAAHQIGNKDFWKTRAVGPMRMAELVDCGTGITGRKADTYRIYMSLITSIEGDGKGGARLHTTLIPFGQDVTGGNTDRIPCGSTGILETVVNESIRNNISVK